MTHSELATYVLEDLPMITAVVEAWLSTDPSFQTFVQSNADKIRSKFRRASEVEDHHDVLAELEFARAILADARFEIEYEPDNRSSRRNPDFLVKPSHASNFNLEVKRVRPSEATQRVREFQQAVVQGIRSVPSSMGVSLDILPASDASALELTRRLPASVTRVVSQIIETIQKTEGTLGKEDTVSFDPKGFEDEIKVTISAANQPPTAPTAWFGGAVAIPYTQREGFKFSDLICGCLAQLRPGIPNVLAIRVNSDTHEPEELPLAIAELSNRLVSYDDAYFQTKRIASCADFKRDFGMLSAILVKGDWGPPRLWLMREASAPLPLEIARHLAPSV